MEKQTFDVLVAGGGPTGMAAALESARQGRTVALLAPSGSHIDTDARTTALMMPSIEMLRRYGVWESCSKNAAALKILRIIDGTERLVRAPTVDFHSSEIGEDAFGYNIPNQDLNLALKQAVTKSAMITEIGEMVSAVAFSGDIATVTLSNGSEIDTQLVVGADGTNSIVRQSAGIEVRTWQYDQTACVMAFDHARSHDNISTEFHTPFGPFTQVPLPGNRSSLVWVKRPEDVDDLRTLEPDALCKEIELQMQSTLGKISNPTKIQIWPLSSMIAHRFSAQRVILVGQAAHAFPPIGAQGLNLGFRDIEDLGSSMQQSATDAGASVVTRNYDRKRRADVYMRTGAVDILNRSLLSSFAPLQIGRAAGMGLLKNIAPLRTIFMREGIKPGGHIRDIFSSNRGSGDTAV